MDYASRGDFATGTRTVAGLRGTVAGLRGTFLAFLIGFMRSTRTEGERREWQRGAIAPIDDYLLS